MLVMENYFLDLVLKIRVFREDVDEADMDTCSSFIN